MTRSKAPHRRCPLAALAITDRLLRDVRDNWDDWHVIRALAGEMRAPPHQRVETPRSRGRSDRMGAAFQRSIESTKWTLTAPGMAGKPVPPSPSDRGGQLAATQMYRYGQMIAALTSVRESRNAPWTAWSRGLRDRQSLSSCGNRFPNPRCGVLSAWISRKRQSTAPGSAPTSNFACRPGELSRHFPGSADLSHAEVLYYLPRRAAMPRGSAFGATAADCCGLEHDRTRP